MRGYVLPSDDGLDHGEEHLSDWESLVINAVGALIEFWGFKRNQGRLWALLYLRHEPMAASDLREQLELSKGAVSMILRELESWGVIQRIRVADSQAWHFLAETDLMTMVSRVFRDREVTVVSRVREDLAEAERRAREDPQVSQEAMERLVRMRRLADVVHQALSMFLKTAQLDISDVKNILKARRGG